MWTLASWWALLALPLPWLVRRFLAPEALDRDAALKVPVAAEFADLAGLRAPHTGRVWRLAALTAIYFWRYRDRPLLFPSSDSPAAMTPQKQQQR